LVLGAEKGILDDDLRRSGEIVAEDRFVAVTGRLVSDREMLLGEPSRRRFGRRVVASAGIAATTGGSTATVGPSRWPRAGRCISATPLDSGQSTNRSIPSRSKVGKLDRSELVVRLALVELLLHPPPPFESVGQILLELVIAGIGPRVQQLQ